MISFQHFLTAPDQTVPVVQLMLEYGSKWEWNGSSIFFVSKNAHSVG